MANAQRDQLAELIQFQFGMVSREQLLRHGVSARIIGYRIRLGGPWQAKLPGVYLTQTGKADVLQRQMAVLLYAGPESVLTGTAACCHHALRAPARDVIDVLVPAGRQRRSVSYVVLQRTARMPDAASYREKLRYATASGPPRKATCTACSRNRDCLCRCLTRACTRAAR